MSLKRVHADAFNGAKITGLYVASAPPPPHAAAPPL